MKKLVLIAAFLSFFSCVNQNTKKNEIANNIDSITAEQEYEFIFLDSGDSIEDTTSSIREYEFVFRNGNDSLTLLKNGHVHGDYIPMEYVGNKIVVPDKFIRFHNETGTSLIFSPEFLAEKIKRSSIDIFPCLLDEEGDRIYCVDLYDESGLRITIFKYPFDKDIISSFFKINEEVWNANYFEDDNIASDIKKAFPDFNKIEERINEIEAEHVLIELFEDFDYDEYDEYNNEEDHPTFI